MTRFLICSLILSVVGSGTCNAAERTDVNELLVFISAFAPGEEGAIHAFGLQLDSGRLKPLHRTTDVEHPFFLALSPDNKFLYSIHAPGQFGGKTNEQIAAFEIQGPSGRLKLLNRQSARGTAACYLDVDATGKTVVVANYSTGSVAALHVRKDGSLGESASFIQHAGSSVNSARQTGPHAHCIVISPDNRFVYSADLFDVYRASLDGCGETLPFTMQSPDEISNSMSIDKVNGKLSLAVGSSGSIIQTNLDGTGYVRIVGPGAAFPRLNGVPRWHRFSKSC